MLVNTSIWGNAASLAGRQLYIDDSTTLRNCCYPDTPEDVHSTVMPTPQNCIHDDPQFATGPKGDFYLNQTAAGEGTDSPCLDAGSDTAANLGLNTKTTRTDAVTDTGQVDIGYHYDP